MSKNYDSEPKIIIDIRNTFPDIRDQGTRPLCLAFAASDLNASTHDENEPLSVEYLSHYSYKSGNKTDFTQGLTCKEVIQALDEYGQPHETFAPYNHHAKSPIIPSTVCKNKFHATGIEEHVLIDELTKSLDSGKAVIIAVKLTTEFFNPIKPFIIDDAAGNSGSHALVVVGYGHDRNNEKLFLIRNSWGETWANNGHAWITSKFISNRAFVSLGLSKLL